ncbi:MAG TPA: efflux transporter outer membrane subunit [Aliidongia sp.]|uniref:efflux transporter outer membrane subunit n=1 Tax=Aliidongia sp. TaxID=1914230 RepID=UPI002DDCF6DB|nr:efflux transporter outer membrane subunit [Aliidongia sp.]HEV2675010.1 efflux transporter outer membrane subunit [Aliidongia sp.]
MVPPPFCRLGALLLAGWTAACTVGPDYKPDGLAVPSAWTEQQPSPADQAAATERLRAWWASFQDPLLDRLVAQAIAGNDDLKIARQRLIQARAGRAIAASVDYPQVTAKAARLQSNSSTTADYPPGIGQYRTWELGFDASWEIDVFGGTRRAEEAADADIGAAIEDRRTILVSLLAELASDYASLRASQLRLSIAVRNIEASRRAFDLTQQEFQRGLGTDLEVAQARAQWNNVRSAPPALKASVARLSHAIAVLVGGFPGDLEVELSKPAPLMMVPASLPVSLPSETLTNRPDVRRAERRYAAATARIGVATADLFPHFSIPLTIDPTSATIGSLFLAKSLDWSIGLAAGTLVYDGGKTDARIENAKAVAEQARLAYEQTVRGAFRDVEDALVTYQTETERNGTLKEAAADSDLALDRATKLYGAGLTDFLKVLDSERAAFAAEDLEAQSRLVRVQNVIALFKALGGGWQGVEFEDARPAE